MLNYADVVLLNTNTAHVTMCYTVLIQTKSKRILQCFLSQNTSNVHATLLVQLFLSQTQTTHVTVRFYAQTTQHSCYTEFCAVMTKQHSSYWVFIRLVFKPRQRSCYNDFYVVQQQNNTCSCYTSFFTTKSHCSCYIQFSLQNQTTHFLKMKHDTNKQR